MTTFTVSHRFVSAKADGPDSTLIRPSNWNDTHDFQMSGTGVLGRVTAGSGSLEVIDLSVFYLPPGLMAPYGGAAAPSGWLLCYGQAVSRTTYATLFAAIGTTFGPGDGATTFNLPDLRGRVAAGADNMGGASANRLYPTMNSGVVGTGGGGQTNTAVTSSGGWNNIAVTSTSMDGANGTQEVSNYTGGAFPAASWHTHANVASSGSNYISVSGTSGAFSIVQPTLITNYIIKF